MKFKVVVAVIAIMAGVSLGSIAVANNPPHVPIVDEPAPFCGSAYGNYLALFGVGCADREHHDGSIQRSGVVTYDCPADLSLARLSGVYVYNETLMPHFQWQDWCAEIDPVIVIGPPSISFTG